MYFSIAEQTVQLPNLPTLSFRVNRADSSLVEIHVSGRGPDGDDGVHVVTFKRNGGQADVAFHARPNPEQNALAGYKSVNDDAVRSPVSPASVDKPLGAEKIDPVHGRITTVGADDVAAKPPEGRNEDSTGLPPPRPAA